MPRPMCGKCNREMRIVKTGRSVLIEAGGTPYEAWSGDEFACQDCGAIVVTQFAWEPIARSHEPDFKDVWTNLLAHNARVVQVR